MNLERIICVQNVKKKKENVIHSKPYKNGNILVNGLVKCKICLGVWNRYVNSATNTQNCIFLQLIDLSDQKYLSREKKVLLKR